MVPTVAVLSLETVPPRRAAELLPIDKVAVRTSDWLLINRLLGGWVAGMSGWRRFVIAAAAMMLISEGLVSLPADSETWIVARVHPLVVARRGILVDYW
ncbi:hypothetical protein ACFORO_19480 [Amycolatopsis halotolerans]|uniref:Uncharacterized protein n=1 Tax=Amycolatopsis halotolerans TaxID=330083 RepID=A0ABV7QLA1_9PSEU